MAQADEFVIQVDELFSITDDGQFRIFNQNAECPECCQPQDPICVNCQLGRPYPFVYGPDSFSTLPLNPNWAIDTGGPTSATLSISAGRLQYTQNGNPRYGVFRLARQNTCQTMRLRGDIVSTQNADFGLQMRPIGFGATLAPFMILKRGSTFILPTGNVEVPSLPLGTFTCQITISRISPNPNPSGGYNWQVSYEVNGLEIYSLVIEDFFGGDRFMNCNKEPTILVGHATATSPSPLSNTQFFDNISFEQF